MKLRAAWWWIDRWRKSTAYNDMTLAEQGAYRNLLDELWLRGGVLPNDDRILAKVCGDAIAWPSVRPSVMARFTLTPEGWRHPTHDEVSSYKNFSKSQSEKGKKGAEARWGKKATIPRPDGPGINDDAPAIEKPDGPAMAFRTPSPYSVLRSPSPSPSPDPESEASVAAKVVGPANGTPPPPPASAGIDYDPADQLQAQLAGRCIELAARTGDSTPLEVFQSVSTTPGGKALTSMRRASRAWLEETLRACDAFEADLDDPGDHSIPALQSAADQQGDFEPLEGLEAAEDGRAPPEKPT